MSTSTDHDADTWERDYCAALADAITGDDASTEHYLATMVDEYAAQSRIVPGASTEAEHVARCIAQAVAIGKREAYADAARVLDIAVTFAREKAYRLERERRAEQEPDDRRPFALY